MVLPYAGVDATTVDEETAVNPYIPVTPAHLNPDAQTTEQRRNTPLGRTVSAQSKPGSISYNMGTQPTGGSPSSSGRVPMAPSTPGGALPSVPTPPAANRGRTNPYDTQNWGVPAMEGGAAAMIEGSRPGSTLASSVGKGIQAFTSGMKETQTNSENWLNKQELLKNKKQDSRSKNTTARAALVSANARLLAAGARKETADVQKLRTMRDPSTGEFAEPGTPFWNKHMGAMIEGTEEAGIVALKALLKSQGSDNKIVSERQMKKLETGTKSLTVLATAGRLQKLIYSGETASGAAMESMTKVRSWIKGLTSVDVGELWKDVTGVDLGDLAANQTYQGLTAAQAATKLAEKALGHNPSNRDLEIIMRAIPNMGLEPAAAAALLDKIVAEARESAEGGYEGRMHFKEAGVKVWGTDRWIERRKKVNDSIDQNEAELKASTAALLEKEWGRGEPKTPQDIKDYIAFRALKTNEATPLGRKLKILQYMDGR